jgi:hypothetical protein
VGYLGAIESSVRSRGTYYPTAVAVSTETRAGGRRSTRRVHPGRGSWGVSSSSSKKENQRPTPPHRFIALSSCLPHRAAAVCGGDPAPPPAASVRAVAVQSWAHRIPAAENPLPPGHAASPPPPLSALYRSSSYVPGGDPAGPRNLRRGR